MKIKASKEAVAAFNAAIKKATKRNVFKSHGDGSLRDSQGRYLGDDFLNVVRRLAAPGTVSNADTSED